MKIMTINDFSKEILNLKSAVIFCHARPDADTLSCAFALYYAFERLGKRAEIVCSTEVSDELQSRFPFKPKRNVPFGYDAFISVDTPSLEQLGEFSDLFLKFKNTFCIDHHVSNTRYAKRYYIENKPACTLVLFEIIKRFPIKIDKTIAELLMFGVITDTLGLSVKGLDSELFAKISELIAFGADYGEVFDAFYRNVPKEKIALIGYSLTRLKYFHDGKTVISVTTKEDLNKFNAPENYTMGLVDILTRIKGVDVGVSVLQSGNKLYRISFRSNKTDVNQIAGVFGGGGHKNASGAVISGYLEDVIDKLIFNIGNYLV